MNLWFKYNALHLAVVALSRRNLDVAEFYLKQAQAS
jgi:hypothetical protein